MSRRALWATAAAVSAAVVLAVVGACFSDGPTTGSAGLEGCRVPISTRPGDVVVAMRELRFIPDSVEIAAGSTVIWVNCDDPSEDEFLTRHTVTSSDDPAAWQSSPLFGPDTIFTLTFDQAGVFPYHCIPHVNLGMVGKVIVE